LSFALAVLFCLVQSETLVLMRVLLITGLTTQTQDANCKLLLSSPVGQNCVLELLNSGRVLLCISNRLAVLQVEQRETSASLD
jgi:hypothetical protein